MNAVILLDTGPLVAYFNELDAHCHWATVQFERQRPPFLTCEPVLTEACFLIGRDGGDPANILVALANGVLRIGLALSAEVPAVQSLMRRYADIGVSLADACLVRMSEIHADSRVMTLDRDFLIYRRSGRKTIPLIAPFAQ